MSYIASPADALKHLKGTAKTKQDIRALKIIAETLDMMEHKDKDAHWLFGKLWLYMFERNLIEYKSSQGAIDSIRLALERPMETNFKLISDVFDGKIPPNEVREKLATLISDFDIHHIVPEPSIFFRPNRKIELTDNLRLVKGDMFFSRLQTLTISVNCLGVMGKGLASRAKYQFPHVYVYYQDLCKQKKLHLGRPYLYKGELSLDYQLADEPSSLENGVTGTCFLLF